MNFRYALTLAQTLYDVEGDTDTLIDIGLVAHNFIGNKFTQLHKVQLDVNCEDGSIQLPCGVDIIEAVTYCGEDWNYTSNTKFNGVISSLYTENYIESRKAFLDPHYMSGKFVKYRKVGDKLYVNKGLGKVNLLYHSIILDEDGLPAINDKEAIAIADYIAHVTKYKEAIRTNNQNVLKMAQELKQQWLFHCDAARVPEHISQNEMDQILNALTAQSWKTYGDSFKPV